MKMTAPAIKPVVWIASTRADLSRFPEEVKDAIGYALYVAQQGGKHVDAKPLRGFGSAGVLEIIENHARQLSGRLRGAAGGTDIRPTRIPKEIENWNQNTE